MADRSDFAPLNATMVRRASTPDWTETNEEPSGAAPAAPGWHADVRLFAITWAAGFVFFLTFIA